MNKDRWRWNKKYQAQDYPTQPSNIVQTYYALAPKGRALDIACGNGRNALFLAKQGFIVDAIDVSDVALAKLAGAHPNLNPVCADLETFDIPQERYSLILNIRFLSRRLFPYIREGLIGGGLLIFETYLEHPGEEAFQPSCRDYLLRENELLHAFLSLKIRFYQEAKSNSPKGPSHCASLVAIKDH
jgi:SAM-dependent methyltransferase